MYICHNGEIDEFKFKKYSIQNGNIEELHDHEFKTIKINHDRYKWPIEANFSLEDFKSNSSIPDDPNEIKRKYDEMERNYKSQMSTFPSNLQIIELRPEGNCKLYLLWLIGEEGKFKLFIFSDIKCITFSSDGKFLSNKLKQSFILNTIL